MKSISVLGCALFAGAALISTTAHSQSLRCKDDLINVGDSKASVQMKCGEPTLKDAFCKPQAHKSPVTPNSGGVCETIDEWTYNLGPGQFIRILRFEAGTLKSISYGDYGK